MTEADAVFMTPTYCHDGSTPTSYPDLYAEKRMEVAKEQALPLIDPLKTRMNHMGIGGEGNGQGERLPYDKRHPDDKGHARPAEEFSRNHFGEKKKMKRESTLSRFICKGIVQSAQPHVTAM